MLSALALASCIKEGRYDTTYILRPQVQSQSVDAAEPLAGVIAYAYNVDTLNWGIASYADAAAGIVTRKDDPTQQLTEPIVRAVPYNGTLGTPESSGEPTVDVATWLQMPFGRSACMVVAVDPANRLYGYTMQQPQLNLPRLYVSVVFQTWREGTSYKNGTWSFYNEFYTPPVVLKAYFRPTLQTEDEGEETAFTSQQIKAYAYVADTTEWRVASYADAAAGVITRKDDSESRTTPNFQAYYESGSGLWGMEVTDTPLMAVVVDRQHRVYAYTKFEPDLAGASPTWPVVFRTWRTEQRYKEDGWQLVNEPESDEN
ncbi:MAG: hypothetical protein K2H42_03880 [Alistipes sp.]|nr:hypothetical protein [Alistipes sp.]